MYKVIGSDQREYGPASEEALRRWIAEGRANGETRAQKEGETGWRPLSTFAELAGALAAAAATVTPPPPPPQQFGEFATAPLLPAAPAPDAGALAASLLARDVRLDISGCIGRGWDLVQKHFWLCVGAWAICLLVAVGACSIPYAGPALGLLFGAALLAGLHWFFLRLLRGEPATIGDVFAGFSAALGPLVLIGVVSQVLQGVGWLLCLLPGLYLAVAWHYAPIAALDKKVDFWGAMELSRQVVTRHWFSVFALFLLAILLWIAGLLLCCVGLFVTGPIATAAIVCAYADLFDAGPKSPAVTL